MGIPPTPRRRRILTVVQALSTGGTERVAATYAIATAAMGFESAILGIYGGGILEAALQAGGVQVWSGADAIAPLCLQSEQEPWDLIHSHNGGQFDPYSDWLIGRLKGGTTRVVQTNVFARADYGPLPDPIDFELLISQSGAWKWSRWVRSAARRRPHGVFPYLVAEQRFRPPQAGERQSAREHFQLSSTAPVVGRIGQPSDSKWDRRILDVFRLIQQRLPDCQLLLVGCPPGISAEIDTLPAPLRAAIQVFPASSDDRTLQAAYWAMDLFLHLSQIGESFGLVLVEAAQSGLPIVTGSTPLKDNSQGEVVRILAAGRSAASVEAIAAHAIDQLRSSSLEQDRNAIASQARLAYGIESNQHLLKQWIDLLIETGDPVALAHLLQNQQASHPCWRRSDPEQWRRQALADLSPPGRLLFRLLHQPWLYRLFRSWRERPYIRQQRRRIDILLLS
ncbi:glycosyltransferase [Synechococcus sp. CS-1324]|uniref:glycosyltransferase n=1 Tax=Synechococcus sp. CS-1324 TaxID=2847980 RepID=UPI00223BC623|nr:glycosyltransferase [Synechococcus sp. CS-1324]MCT0229495.1 glycosyltransferase [Synechococcus sp. CS-1324]